MVVRLMTLTEKQQLQRMIKNLPPRNLDSVVEIIQHRHRQSNEYSCREIHIDLEKEVNKNYVQNVMWIIVTGGPLRLRCLQDNVTLWRLYFYIEAVENAKKLRNG